MYNFYTADLDFWDNPEDEVWPIGFTAVLENLYIFYLCGSTIYCSYLDEKELSCFNALDDRFLPYGSFSLIILKGDLAEALPPGTEDAKYCHLQSQGPGALLGMNETFLLTGGVCIDDTYQCFSNGTLLAYSEQGCSGDVNEFTLSSEPAVFNSSILGQFNASLITVSSEKSPYKYVYNAWLPANLLVPHFKIPFEIFALICFVLAMILLIYWLAEVMYRIYKNPQSRKLFTYNELLCYVIRLVRTCFEFTYWVILTDQAGLANIFTSMTIFGAFGSLVQILLCTQIFLFEIHGFKTWQRVAFLVLLFCIHIGLAGSAYIAYYGINYDLDVNMNELYNSWRKSTVYWEIFAQVYVNILPLLLIHQFLVLQYEKSTLAQRFQVLMEIDKVLIYSLIAQVLFQILGAVTRQLVFGISYRDDRVTIAMGQFKMLVSVVLTWLATRIAHGIRAVGKHRNPKKEQVLSLPSDLLAFTG